MHVADDIVVDRPLAYTGIFAQPGALVRTPGGNVEDVARYKNAGLRWFLHNLEHPPTEWNVSIGKCQGYNIPWGFWFHCRAHAQLEHLLEVSRDLNTPIIGINVEAELSTILSPNTVLKAIVNSRYKGEISLQVYGWIQNGVDMTPLNDFAIMLEMFPADAKELWDDTNKGVKWSDCNIHARAQGVKYPQCLMQAYHFGQPEWYRNSPDPKHIYTLDDATGENGPIERWVT